MTTVPQEHALYAEATAFEAADTLPDGTALLRGQYLIERYLCSGGFGITYLARDSLDRRVVVKECFPSSMCCRAGREVGVRSGFTLDELDTVVHLFDKEARRLARLDHPNIVGVRDVFKDNGTAYMALDFIKGSDLQDVADFEPWRLTPDLIRSMTLSLLDAIGHVHARGMLHRDISPDNVILNEDNRPVLIDFGAARDNARRQTRALSTLRVVKEGYSPQEFYLQGGEHLPSSDLYSLAATLYMLITGDPPINWQERVAAVAEGAPDPYVPLDGAVAGYDARFLQTLDQALSVFVRDRPTDAVAWLSAIAGSECDDVPRSDDSEIVDRIRRLVEATNPEVRRLQTLRARERADKERRETEERVRKEAARAQLLERARQEAEEAELARQARERSEARARAVREAEARRRAALEALDRLPANDAEAQPHEASTAIAGLDLEEVNRADRLRQQSAALRAAREAEVVPVRAVALGAANNDDGPGRTGLEGQTRRRSLLSRVFSRGHDTSRSAQTAKHEGYGT